VNGRGAAIALAWALSGCDVEADIVAAVPSEQSVDQPDDQSAQDAGSRRDGGAPVDASPVEADPPSDAVPLEEERPFDAGPPSVEADAGVPYDPLTCADDARHLMLIDKSGSLSRLRADSLTVEPLGTPDCLTRGVVAAALDQQGVLWVSTQDRQLWWIRPGNKECESADPKASVGPLAFAYDRETNRELLYFVQANDLLVGLDPITFAQMPIGPVKPSLLVGTGSAGDLLALSEIGDSTLSLDFVGLDDAVTTPMWKLGRKVGQTLRAAAGWRGEIAILLDAELYTYRRESDALSLLVTAPPLVGTFVALASSVCGASPK